MIKEKRTQKDQYGMALAERIKDHYNIEPTSIFNDEQITVLKDFEQVKKYQNVLLYVYGNWPAESYIGYSFFKEIVRELEEEIVCSYIQNVICRYVIGESSPFYPALKKNIENQTPWFFAETVFHEYYEQVIEDIKINNLYFDYNGNIQPLIYEMQGNKITNYKFDNIPCKIENV